MAFCWVVLCNLGEPIVALGTAHFPGTSLGCVVQVVGRFMWRTRGALEWTLR